MGGRHSQPRKVIKTDWLRPVYPFNQLFAEPPSEMLIYHQSLLSDLELPAFRAKYEVFAKLSHENLIAFESEFDSGRVCQSITSVKTLYQFVPRSLPPERAEQLFGQAFQLGNYLNQKGVDIEWCPQNAGFSKGLLKYWLRFDQFKLISQKQQKQRIAGKIKDFILNFKQYKQVSPPLSITAPSNNLRLVRSLQKIKQGSEPSMSSSQQKQLNASPQLSSGQNNLRQRESITSFTQPAQPVYHAQPVYPAQPAQLMHHNQVKVIQQPLRLSSSSSLYPIKIKSQQAQPTQPTQPQQNLTQHMRFLPPSPPQQPPIYQPTQPTHPTQKPQQHQHRIATLPLEQKTLRSITFMPQTRKQPPHIIPHIRQPPKVQIFKSNLNRTFARMQAQQVISPVVQMRPQLNMIERHLNNVVRPMPISQRRQPARQGRPAMPQPLQGIVEQSFNSQRQHPKSDADIRQLAPRQNIRRQFKASSSEARSRKQFGRHEGTLSWNEGELTEQQKCEDISQMSGYNYSQLEERLAKAIAKSKQVIGRDQNDYS